MNVLDRARALLESQQNIRDRERLASNKKIIKEAAEESTKFFETRISVQELNPENINGYWYRFWFKLDGIFFRASYEKRGYDNLGAHYEWYFYVKTQKTGWMELISLERLVTIADYYGLAKY